MNTCNDCKYYYRDESYCTHHKKSRDYTNTVCEDFILGLFNERFYVYAESLEYGVGYYYILQDNKHELVDDNGESIGFKYEDDADHICYFLNNQENRLHQLQLWVNEIYYESSIEREYWKVRKNEIHSHKLK